MTISSTARSVTYTGNGSTTLFAIPFYWISDPHIVVTLRQISNGNLTAQVLGTDYTLTGAGVLSGGSCTMVVAPPSTHELIIARTVPIVQLSDYVSNDRLAAETVERDYDYGCMVDQQLSDSIAAIAGGASLTFQNLGTGQGHVYSGTAGTVVQLKSLKQAGGTTITENANEITISSTASGLDTTIDYSWTGKHTFTKQAARTLPSWVLKSLQGGVDITDSSILLASDYVAAMDIRKNTDVSVEAPVDASWGGNAGIYIQHKASGTCGANGTLTLGIRAQLETTQAKGASSINDAVAMYGSVYNNGTDVGAFGHHVDAYHVGTAGAGGHSTLGMSSEIYKQITGGTAAGYVTRSQGSQLADFGLLICHAGSSQWRRGIQLGSPTYANGGVQGAPGTATGFAVGVDLTWGNYTYLAMSIKRDTAISLSGLAQAQTALPDVTCNFYWSSLTGNFTVSDASTARFEVNMTYGYWRQNNNDTWAAFDTASGRNWLFRMSSTNKVSNTVGGAGGAAALPSNPDTYIVVQIDGVNRKIPAYNP